jgi:hypothetical protein
MLIALGKDVWCTTPIDVTRAWRLRADKAAWCAPALRRVFLAPEKRVPTMAKNPGKGQCVHCLKEGVERNWDHVFPQSWYPDTTAADMEKWQIPSCIACNDRYGKLERDLIGRLGLALDAKNSASAGLADTALRAINPDAAKNDGDAAARGQKRFYVRCTKEKSSREKTWCQAWESVGIAALRSNLVSASPRKACPR